MKDQDKTRQQLIAENEELRRRVSTVMSNLPGMAYRCRNDPQWTMEFISDGCVPLTGYTPRAFTGNHELAYADIIHPDDREPVWEQVQQAIAENRHFQLEYRIQTASGEEKWVWEQGIAVYSDSGQAEALEGLMTDITDRKQAEEELRKSEQRYRLFIESIPQTVWRSDPEGNVLDCNRHWCEYTGQTSEEAKGDGWSRAVHPDDLERVGKQVREDLARGKLYQCEQRLRRASDGNYRWHLARGVPVKDDNGNITGWIGSTTDIHDQKCAEEAFRQSEQRLSLHFQQTPLAAIEWDVEGRVTKWNPSAEKTFAYSPEEALGRHFSFIVPPGAREHTDHLADDLLTSNGGHRSTNENVTKDGRTILCEWYNTPLMDAGGKVVGAASLAQDITDRKRAEEALRKAHDELEQKVKERTAELSAANEQLRIFQQFAETSGQGFSMADLGGHLVYMNPALCRMLGEDKPHGCIGQHISIYYPDEVNRTRKTERFPVLMRDGYWQGELPMLSRQGKTIPTWHNTFLIRDESGKPIRIAVVITDISERKRAEEALQTSEQKYRTLVETSPDGVIMTDLKGHVTYASGPVREYFGAERVEDLFGRNPLDLLAKEDHHRFLNNLRRTMEEGATRDIEYTFLKQDGTSFPGDLSTAVIRDASGKPNALVAILRDVTERHRAQEALRRSEERYALAVQSAGVGLWDWDIRTGKLYFSPRWKAIFGYDENDIGDSVEDWARLLHPDETDWMLRFLEDFLAGTSPTVTVEYRLRHKDGSYRWIVAHGLAVRDDQGKAIRLVGSHGDITDRKQAEAALERERQSLWRMLQASDHERQIISYEIHDGLAQYLGGAIMQFQAYDALEENSPDEAKKAHETAVELVRQSHLEARRLISEVRPPVIDEVGLETAISHLVHEQRRHGGPKIECDSDVQFDRLPPILENAIYRIIQEALNNACKHSQSKRVKVTMTQEGQDVRMEVQDWGIGFDPESVEKGHFGLEGVRQRVRLLGGRLTIESTPGSGTVVRVVVPIVERPIEE